MRLTRYLLRRWSAYPRDEEQRIPHEASGERRRVSMDIRA
jgi:hypothetical protein